MIITNPQTKYIEIYDPNYVHCHLPVTNVILAVLLYYSVLCHVPQIR